MKAVFNQFLRFAAVGAVATAVHYAVMLSLVELGGMHPVTATFVGFCCGAVVSYTLNRRFTFETRPSYGRGFAKFFFMVGIGAFINAGIVWVLTHNGFHYMVAQVIATGLVMIWNFASARFIVFRAPAADVATPRP